MLQGFSGDGVCCADMECGSMARDVAVGDWLALGDAEFVASHAEGLPPFIPLKLPRVGVQRHSSTPGHTSLRMANGAGQSWLVNGLNATLDDNPHSSRRSLKVGLCP